MLNRPYRATFADGTGKSGAAVFTWRNDYRATGWLAAYSRLPG